MNRASRAPAGGPTPAGPAAPAPRAFDPRRVRAEFPILARAVRGRPLVYLDNAATTQKPTAVLEALDGFYRAHNANIHRAVHTLSQEATLAFDAARETVRRFLNAADAREVIFTRGTTEGINLVAQAWGRASLRAGDEVLVTTMEHHSNIVPWQLVAAERGAVVRAAPIDDDGTLDLDAFRRLLGPRTRMVAVGHVSNALGTVNPVAELAREAHAAGALVLVDGAQAVAHARVDVRALGADFYAFSGHKVFGPTGIGALWGRRELLEAMPPWQGGGDMIDHVSFERTTFAPVPHKFEAGTPDIAGVIGLDAAVHWLGAQDRTAIAAHEETLWRAGRELLDAVGGVVRLAVPDRNVGILTFTVDGAHPHDVASLLDQDGICVRAGHHCTQPLHRRLGLPATVRASIAPYTALADLEALAAGLRRVRQVFA